MSENVPTKQANAWFNHQLKIALNALYDPTVLRNSPLTELFKPGAGGDLAALRQTLTAAIEALRPSHTTPTGSRTWRVYQILRKRYTEGLSQRQAAANFGLSIRQFQREERLAREMLADALWAAHVLEGRVPDLAAAAEVDDESETGDEDSARQQELDWLRSSVPVQITDVDQVIGDVLATVKPLAAAAGVQVAWTPQTQNHDLPLRGPILRQGLLDIVTTAINGAPGGELRLQAEIRPGQMWIGVQATANAPHSAEGLEMADELIRICGGSLHRDAADDRSFNVEIVLPIPEQAAVLCIDDNDDALQLLQRYLAGSRYLFIGAQDAQRGLDLATELAPRAIVVDVMMPEKDGWALLGQLREHPRTGKIPIIICTILPQRDLALVLGAAEFIRKPVKRAELLTVLDRLVARRELESYSAP